MCKRYCKEALKECGWNNKKNLNISVEDKLQKGNSKGF